MARNTTAKGKIVRRFGVNIYGQPKFDNLLKKKPNGPGKNPRDRSRKKTSDYGLQLTEKQKFRFAYGVSERQFRNLYRKAKSMGGVTGNQMIALLESRIDNVIYRLGWAATRAQARQMVTHKHILLNGKCHNIPSTRVHASNIITVKNRKKIIELIRKNLTINVRTAPWLSLDSDELKGTVDTLPGTEDTQPVGNIQMVVEYYSRK